MSEARGALLGLLYGARPAALEAAYEAGEHRERERDVDVVLSLHAHELAEKIRAFTITPSGHPSCDDGKDAGLDVAADLIDPKVSK